MTRCETIPRDYEPPEPKTTPAWCGYNTCKIGKGCLSEDYPNDFMYDFCGHDGRYKANMLAKTMGITVEKAKRHLQEWKAKVV
jgi:hypothetical protein